MKRDGHAGQDLIDRSGHARRRRPHGGHLRVPLLHLLDAPVGNEDTPERNPVIDIAGVIVQGLPHGVVPLAVTAPAMRHAAPFPVALGSWPGCAAGAPVTTV